MTATKRTKRLAANTATKLEAHVKRWVNRRASDYPARGAEGVLKDLFRGGCASGVVSHLVYYSDTTRFFKRFRADITALLCEACDESGCGPAELFGDKWDASDPLAANCCNQNLLAWFGFEEAARTVAARDGIV